ncbi:MAG: nicotinate-nucleotide diphosphorylase (carboxylating), partial [Chitinophagales bacterium]|nr:nicotinate-nucleotide diphosphorylase (carboxylating) [Hyphomicrobiales bacterium]
EQLDEALRHPVDAIMLDNMTPTQLRKAVAIARAANPRIILEASGGVTLETVRGMAETGVDLISSGALTHSAKTLDVGFDFQNETLF